jgi:hypothetical protein
MKRAIHGSLVAFLTMVALATPSFAGQSNGGPKNPIGGGTSQNQDNGNVTGQGGTNGSSIHGNGNAVNQTVNNQNDTTQINNIDQSIKPNTNSSATSGSSSSNGLVQNTNSKVDGRQDGGSGQVVLPSVYNNTNTWGKFSNICGVTTAEMGVTPVTKSVSAGFNFFGAGGANFGLSNQKFTKEQKPMLLSLALAMSRNNSETASFMSNPVLRKVYIKQALRNMFIAEGLKPEQASLEAEAVATEAAAIDSATLIRSTAEFCSIYKQGITPVAEPQVEQPPAPIEIPSVPTPVEALN